MAKRETLKRPTVQPRQANMELRPWGHWPRGLSASGMSSLGERSHDLKEITKHLKKRKINKNNITIMVGQWLVVVVIVS